MNPAEVQRPEVINYDCYRQLMQDSYNFKKSVRDSFSYRQFSQTVGVKSPNYMQMVIGGKRNLSNALSHSVARALGLSGIEEEFFVSLVRLDNAVDQNERIEAQKQLLILSKRLCSTELAETQSAIIEKWYHLLVRELVALEGFKPEASWIVERLKGLITVEQAEESLNLLLQSGFVGIKNGKWQQTEPVLSTGNSYNELLINRHHASTLANWSKMLEVIDSEERELGLINIPIRRETIPQLKEKMRSFQEEIIGWLKDEQDPEELVQLGVYLFKVTE